MKKETGKAAIDQEQVVGIFSEQKAESIQELLGERAKRAALSFGLELLEQDVESLCGARYSRNDSEYSRYGTEKSSVIIGGARYGIERPRVRGKQGEVYPESLKKLRKQDLLDEQMKEAMLMGVSTRNYEKVIQGYSEKTGVSKSTVARAFGRASKKELDAINEADLSDYSFVSLMIDGLEIGSRTVIAAIGITAKLEKVPVGLIEGNTENSTIVIDLLERLIERGFKLHCEKLLCVLDGSKALKKAVVSVFGTKVLIQRCWLHKLRNIQSYLPKEHHKTLLWRMKKLMGLNSLADAKKEYNSIHSWLKNISVDAANSLEEAGENLLTVHMLGVTGELRKSLSSTNIIESLFSVVRAKLRNVKNWHSKGNLKALKWIASAINQHRNSNMRKLRGLNQKNKLISALGISLDDIKNCA